MTRQFTKKQRSEMRQLRLLAWERELGNEIATLDKVIRSWRNGDIDAFDVSDEIHQFHDKRSRSLYSLYSSSGSSSFSVPNAIAKGVIAESEVSDGLLEEFREAIIRAVRGVDDEREN